MNAKEFWLELEYRICRGINGLRGVEVHGLWCDGVIPEGFEYSAERSAVTGRAWMGRGGRHHEKWRFELVLPSGTRSLDEVNWGALFPPEDKTGWLELHHPERFLRINPAAAVPSPSRPIITAEVTFLTAEEAGRARLPVFDRQHWYMPHIVIQSRNVRRCSRDTDGMDREPYQGVAFVEGPSDYRAGHPGQFVLELMYYPAVPYSDVVPGATFTVREGGRIVRHGVVLSRMEPAVAPNRPLNSAEYALLRWMLEHADERAASFVSQLDRVRVTPWRCPCGCASFNMVVEGMPEPSGGMEPLADFTFGPPDQTCGIFPYAQNGVLAGVEVVGYTVDAPKALPAIESLRLEEQRPAG